jgi:hypothetical protein
MTPARTVRTVWIVLGLVLGFAVVLAGPALLLWNTFVGSTPGERDLKADFQSVRYEAGGLIFRYTVHNLTQRSVQFLPTLTEVHAVQAKDRPAVGYPNILLPFTLPGRGSHVVEVRLELPSALAPPASLSDEQTRQVLETQPLGTPAFPDTPVSPLPMRGPVAPAVSPGIIELSVQGTLTDLNGFVIEDEANGLRLVLPRGW